MELNQEEIRASVNQASRKIVEAIVRDVTDRSVLGFGWNQIKAEAKTEIRAEWRSMIQRILTEFGMALLKEVLDPIQGALDKELGGPPDGTGL